MLSFFLSIISGLIWSINNYFNQKILKFELSNVSNKFWSVSINIFLIIILLAFVGNIKNGINSGIIIIIIYVLVIKNISKMLDNYLQKNEKLSTLLPYNHINKFLAIIFALILFQDTSFITFLMSVIWIILIIIFSIDVRNLTKPYHISTVLINQFLKATELLGIWFLLTRINFVWYFAFYNFILFFAILFIVFYKNEYKTIFSYPKNFYKNKIISSILFSLELLIWLYLIQSIGLILTILISSITIVWKILFNYFFLKQGQKRDITFAIILTICILLWIIFKNFA